MDIIKILNESKRRTNMMNGISLDWQYAQHLIPKVLNDSKDHTAEFIENARVLTILLDSVEESARELKAQIPKFQG
jgi:hypothetical protein